MSDVYRIGVTIAMNSNGLGVLGALGAGMMKLDKAALAATGRMNALKVAALGAMGVVAGAAVLHGMGHLVAKGAELVHQQSLLRRQGLSNLEVLNATAKAYETMAAVPGTKVAENLKMFGELRSQTTSDQTAMQLMPMMSRLSMLMQNETGKAQEGLARDLMKVLENRGQIFDGKHQTDMAKVKIELDMAYQAMAASHGGITSRDLLNFQKQAGPAGMAMSPDAYYRLMPTAIQTMGGHRAGTAMSSLFAQFVGGVMTQRTAKELMSLDLLDPNKVHVRRGGQVTIDEGGIRGFDASNPFLFGKVFKDAVERRGGNTAAHLESILDPKMVAALYKGLGRDTTRRLLAEFIQLSPIFARDHDLRMKTMDPAAAATEARNDPKMAMKALSAAVDNLMATFGAPLVPYAVSMINSLSSSLTQLTSWAKANPALVETLGLVAVGLGALLGVGGALAISAVALSALGFLTGPLGLAALAIAIVAVAAAVGQGRGGPSLNSPREMIGAGLTPGPRAGMAQVLASYLPSANDVMVCMKQLGTYFLLGLGVILNEADAALLAGARMLVARTTELLNMAGAAILDWARALPGRLLGALGGAFGNTPEGRAGNQRSNDIARGALGPDGYGRGLLAPGFQNQSFAPPPPANGNRATPIVFELDGREVARGVIPHLGREMNRVPSGRTGFDARMSPRYGGGAFNA